jgi:hypothetical protein
MAAWMPFGMALTWNCLAERFAGGSPFFYAEQLPLG